MSRQLSQGLRNSINSRYTDSNIQVGILTGTHWAKHDFTMEIRIVSTCDSYKLQDVSHCSGGFHSSQR
uniref:Uncharacterized protein n=1 Tax=Ciona savignyi TaxID=51511 RepID=H2Z048_CIOSA